MGRSAAVRKGILPEKQKINSKREEAFSFSFFCLLTIGIRNNIVPFSGLFVKVINE